MCLTFGDRRQTSTRDLGPLPFRTSLRVVRRAMGQAAKVQQTSANGMTTVEAITAGSGDAYRIERVYLDRDQAYGFAQDYNEIAPVNPSRWRSGRPVPRRGLRRPYWRAEWWARVPVSKRGDQLRHTRDGERRDDFDIRREWWTGTPCRSQGGHRKLAGYPRQKWRACRTRKSRKPREHDCPVQSRSSQSLRN